ncbi:diguanylate cyclase domain-containing protein [Actinoplanes sp. GCM10030250]|uniref:diguanylate cyclase domain-containing protein n=1 Tax=Actinoplanes sp. GCM10030250 TaxID=3273376 RepID=UPI003611C88B
MPGRAPRRKVAARGAVVGLSLGVVALAGLAVFSTSGNAETTRHVRQVAEQSDQWAELNLNVSMGSDALADYQRGSSAAGRIPLESAIGSANGNLAWLANYGDLTDVEQAAEATSIYAGYARTIRDLAAADDIGDREKVEVLAQQASLATSTLRKAAINQVSRKRLDMDRYLADVEQRNERLLMAAAIILCVDLVLLAVCATVLLGYQRRVESEASEHQRRALHDSLTGLANRTMLGARIEEAMADADQHEEPFGLLILDLNRFKEVNDTLGHHVGDLLLQEVAARLSAAVRDTDTVARLGGDEFAVLLPQSASADACLESARRLLDRVQGPADLAGARVDISASIGAAVYPFHGTNAVELFQRADIAMYTAKRSRSGAAIYHVGIETPQPKSQPAELQHPELQHPEPQPELPQPIREHRHDLSALDQPHRPAPITPDRSR